MFRLTVRGGGVNAYSQPATTNKTNTCSPVESTSTSDNSLSSKFPYGSPRRCGLHTFVIYCQIYLDRVCNLYSELASLMSNLAVTRISLAHCPIGL